MNIRKAIIYFKYLTYIYVIYSLYAHPLSSEWMCVLAFCVLISIEIILFSDEYYSLLKPQKAILMSPKKPFLNIAFLSNLALLILFYVVMYLKHSNQLFTSWGEFLLLTVVSFETSCYMKRKNSILISSHNMFFNHLFHGDICLDEIEKMSISKEANRIEFLIADLSMISIDVDDESFSEQKEKLEKLSNLLNTDKENTINRV